VYLLGSVPPLACIPYSNFQIAVPDPASPSGGPRDYVILDPVPDKPLSTLFVNG